MMQEEIALYEKARVVEGRYRWIDPESEGGGYGEDQLMEDFTFSIAKRLLGVRIDLSEGDELIENIPFTKYQKSASPVSSSSESSLWDKMFSFFL